MKKILSLFLVLVISLSLFGCGKYDPVESTKLEQTEIASMKNGKTTYKANYELFRMLFLSAKETLGDKTDAATLAEAKEIALDRMLEIYSVFALADALEIDLYSRTVDKQVEESITLSIEGGIGQNGQELEGVGSYEKYLENLKLFYMNYAVADLMIRYSYGVSAIGAYFRGTYDDHGLKEEEGKLSYTDEDVTGFYNSADTRRILLVFTQKEASEAQDLRDRIAALATEEQVSAFLLGNTTANEVDARGGQVIGLHTLDNSVYKDVTDAAFALEVGETSAPIPGISDGFSGYYILYRAEKSSANLDEMRPYVEKNYVENEIGKRYHEMKTALEKSLVTTEFFKGLDLSAIRMDEEAK